MVQVGNLVIMNYVTSTEIPPSDPQTITGWFAGRLPDGWFTAAPDVTVDAEQILVTGTLPEGQLPTDATPETRNGFEAGRISRYREQTRGERIQIARQAEQEFKKPVTWAVKLGSTHQTFTRGGSGRSGRGEHGGEPSVTIRGKRHGVVNAQVF